MYIANLRVTHNTAAHEVLDHILLKESEIEGFYKEFLSIDNIDEALLLQTCNRFEVYFTGKNEDDGKAQAREFILNRFGADIEEHLVIDSYLDTLEHLFRVVSSIDSMIVGENQILAQMKDAQEHASYNKFTGRVLEPIFQKALFVGKRIRTETKISNGKISISSAAVDLANQHNTLRDKNVMIIGTGKMASLLAEHLSTFEPKELVVVGRTPERLERFCQIYSGRSINIANYSDELPHTDVLFSATTCPRVLVAKDVVEKAMDGRERTLTLVDIAVPADIDQSVVDIPNTQYFSIDDLREISLNNKAARQKEVERAQVIIREELKRLKFKLENLHTDRFLSNLNLYTEEIRSRELEKALNMLDGADPRTAEIIEDLSKSLTKKILHNFMTEIRSNPATADEMDRFLNIFMGNGHVSRHPNEKTEE